MIPRVSANHRVHFTSSLARQAQFAASGRQQHRGVHTCAVSRAPAVVASARLVLRPTGNGNTEHIGDDVKMPPPIPLQDGLYEVGRASPADIQINIPTVSSRHALLRVEDNKVCITDLNSTNGTLVDGKELGPMDNIEVEVGSEVIFGDMYLAKFRLDEVPDSAPMEELSDQTSAMNPNNTVMGTSSIGFSR
eukprot:GHUV01003066.1.p2 GENE.GHUV01003066.1~~GHUV01003066.1.p2  ORF type:complete len:192 (+),score=47.40 GHUV01003066.1:321-896(+)